MKKFLLSALMLSASVFASAQTCVSGYSSTGIYDDFSSATAPANLNFFAEVGANPGGGQPDCSGFTATETRTETPGKLGVVMMQPYGCYTPFGFTFGKTSTNKTRTIDLTSDKTFSFTITNSSSDTSSISGAISIIDSLGNVLNVGSGAGTDPGGCNNSYLYSFTTGPLAAGGSATVTGTFAGAYNADYTQPSGPQNCTLTQTLDYTIVSKIIFVVINTKQNITDSYRSYQIGNGTNPLIYLDDLRVGACPTSTGVNAASFISNTALFPNPATETVNVELNLKKVSDVKVTLTDLMGKEVKVISETRGTEVKESFSVANLQRGIYTVNYFVDGASAKAELLMVK